MPKQAELLIDVSRLIWRLSSGRLPTGIDRVCLEYVRHFADRAQGVIQWKGIRRILPYQLSQDLFEVILTAPRTFFRRTALLALQGGIELLRSQPGRGRPYLNLGHTGLDRPGLTEWIERIDVRPIFMIHDLIPITHPVYCRAGESDRHRKRVDVMLDTGVGILGNSQVTLDILRRYAAEGCRRVPPTLAAWLGATPLPASGPLPPDISTPYFLALGTIEGRKNHVLLLKIWQALVTKLGNKAPRLVIVGQRGWENDEALAILEAGTALRGHVIELARCSDAELAHYLRDARALLFPSFAEGYGMPLVEALGHGTPVIASDLAVFRELAGNIPDYIDADNAVCWQATIEEYSLTDCPARRRQLTRMTDYVMPTWSAHFARVDAWLETLPVARQTIQRTS